MSFRLTQPLAGCVLALVLALPTTAHAEKGMLVITSEPGGAKIYLNGARKGTTPVQQGKELVLDLEEGE